MNITIVSAASGDWAGAYFNNALKTEGHSVRYDELLDELVLCKEVVDCWKDKTVLDSFLEDSGSLPPLLSSINESDFVEY